MDNNLASWDELDNYSVNVLARLICCRKCRMIE